MPSHRHAVNTNINCTGFGSQNCMVRGAGGTTEWKDNGYYMKSTGGGAAHNNMPPYIVQNFIIKAKMSGTINKNNTYSTSESKTGEIWIDGKPIYRKVFVGNWTSNTSGWTNLVKGNISNCDTVISIKGLIKNPRNGDNIPIPSYENTNYFANIMYNQSDDYIICFLNGWTYNEFKMTYIIVLEYTKTTD